MRWKISTESRTEDKNNERRKITKVTKTQYITIGDIVGMGKSAAGAVQKLAKDLPAFASSLKEKAAATAEDAAKGAISSGRAAANEAAAWAINAVVQPLAIILNGMEKFRKVMQIVDMITPIAKTIARTTGVWCSPGNVMDLLDIAKGVITQILIAVLTTSILRLKELIWNYEFDIREISEETSILICNLLKKFDKENENNKLDPNVFDNELKKDDTDNDEDNDEDNKNFKNKDDKINKLIDDSYPDDESNSNVGVDDILALINGGFTSKDDKDKALAKISNGSNSYKTEYIVNGEKRKLYGSLEDGGIYYSDDKGKTWNKSKQTNGSFACFAKILVNNKWRYLAGSTHYVKAVSLTTDTSSDDYLLNGCYKKDYYNKQGIKLTKKEKDKILQQPFADAKNFLYDKQDSVEATGIYYSDDDGITWQQTEITTGSYELFFEFQEKIGHPARVVASSYDYKGVLYTEDGNSFIRSNYTDGTEINAGRWVFYADCDSELSNTINVNNIDCETIIDNPFINTVEQIKANQKIDITFDPFLFIGDDIDGYNKELINQILDYIHENYTDNLLRYSKEENYEFWRKLIDDINKGNYTLEDAKKGIRL